MPDTLQDRKIRGMEAKSLLDNKLFKDAFERVNSYIEGKALSCDPDNKDQAQRVILSKQLLAAIKREIARSIKDGEVAEIQISELEKKKGLRAFIR